MYNISSAAEQHRAYGMGELHEMSHGEALLAVAMDRFTPKGLYILDEPEAALSPQRQLTLLARIRQLVLKGSQFIISSHSSILMAYPAALIYCLDSAGIQQVAYQDTEHYVVTRAFLQNPERMLEQTFDEVDAEEP